MDPLLESSASAQAWLDSHNQQFDLFINNQWVKPSDESYLDVANPATEQPIAKIADAKAGDIDKAFKAARKAFKSWLKAG